MRKRKENIQAANRREEERQAGCHTSKTGTQLQQTAERRGHGREEKQGVKDSKKDKDRNSKVFVAKLVGQIMQPDCFMFVDGFDMYVSMFALKTSSLMVKTDGRNTSEGIAS